MTDPATDAQLDWGDLALILEICRAESLSGAARSLGQTHSTVFRRINAIEEKTGVRFFDRFRHGYVMTDAGRTAMEYAERIETEVLSLGREVLGRDEALRGRIRVTCPEVFAEDHAPGIVARFCAEHPEIKIDLAPSHGAVDLNRREAEVAIRATRSAPEASFGRRICDFRFAMFASGSYIAAHPEPDPSQQTFCAIEGTVGWLQKVLGGKKDTIENRTIFQCRATRAVQNACAEGLGVALLPCYVGDADARLERVSPTLASFELELWVLTHPDLRKTARVRAFMSHVYQELAYGMDLYAGKTKGPRDWVLGVTE